MLRIMDRNEDYTIIYSENEEEIQYLKPRTKTTIETTYKGCPAIVVRKDKGKAI